MAHFIGKHAANWILCLETTNAINSASFDVVYLHTGSTNMVTVLNWVRGFLR